MSGYTEWKGRIDNFRFSESTATDLITKTRLLADEFHNKSSRLQQCLGHAMPGFEGHFAELFEHNCNIAMSEARAVARAAQDASNHAGFFRDTGLEEKRARDALRSARSSESDGESSSSPELILREARLDGPLTRSSEPAYEAVAVSISVKQTPPPGCSDGGAEAPGGQVSASPDSLVKFSQDTRNFGDQIGAQVKAARTAVSEYSKDCSWGHFDADAIFASSQRWADSHQTVTTWIEKVAAAFVIAGSDAEVGTLSYLADHIPAEPDSPHELLILTLIARTKPSDLKKLLDSHASWIKELSDSPPSMPAVKAWWSSLKTNYQESLESNAPELIGNLAGVPYSARDVANRHWLDKELKQAKEDLANARVMPVTPGMDANASRIWNAQQAAQITELENRLSKLQGLSDALSSDLSRKNTRQLIQFFPAGSNPKASISSGDLDSATRVGIFTPGMNSSLSSTGDNTTAAEDILHTTSSMQSDLGDHDSLAMITFLNYDAPPWSADRKSYSHRRPPVASDWRA